MALTTAMSTGATTTHNPTVAFTTPQNYAARLSHILIANAFKPLWCPTLIVQPTPSNLARFLSPYALDPFSAVAFTSRTGIQSFSHACKILLQPTLPPHGPDFIVAALGIDAKLLDREFRIGFCGRSSRVRVLVPPTATPSSLVKALGPGGGRKILCPVPAVVGVEEPPVVPSFLRELRSGGWIPVRVDAYETRWVGPRCAEVIVRRSEEEGGLDAVVFTSTAEVEGLLKSLKEFGLGFEDLRRRCPGLVVAAHGPVTAAGAERLGVKVDVVSSNFYSFDGVVDALKVTIGKVKNLDNRIQM